MHRAIGLRWVGAYEQRTEHPIIDELCHLLATRLIPLLSCYHRRQAIIGVKKNLVHRIKNLVHRINRMEHHGTTLVLIADIHSCSAFSSDATQGLLGAFP